MTYKYKVEYTTEFKKDYKKAKKQKKDLNKLKNIIEQLACGKKLEAKYRNHKLINNKRFKDCMECHIEPDWLLVYRKKEKEIVLLLVNIGSHSTLFK